MSIGSKELAITELDTFEDERLAEELKKAKAELFNLRFQSATGQLESHGRVRQVKRDIARIYTVLRERELGIRPTPAAAPEPVKAKKSTKKTCKLQVLAQMMVIPSDKQARLFGYFVITHGCLYGCLVHVLPLHSICVACFIFLYLMLIKMHSCCLHAHFYPYV